MSEETKAFPQLTAVRSHNVHYIDLERIDDDSILVDAGGHLGLFEEALKLLHSCQSCKIIVLECDRNLKQLIENKHLYNVIVIEKALGGQSSAPGGRVFYQYIGLPGWGSFYHQIEESVSKLRCKGVIDYAVESIGIKTTTTRESDILIKHSSSGC